MKNIFLQNDHFSTASNVLNIKEKAAYRRIGKSNGPLKTRVNLRKTQNN